MRRTRSGQVRPINVWHWAHRSNDDCDTWAESVTDWHRAYQKVVPAAFCEVIRGPHRADVVSASGHVLELQHSAISTEDIAKREQHYGPRMYWLFDIRQAYETGRFDMRRGKDDAYVTFRWKHARQSVLTCRRPVLLDLGEGLVLRVKKIHSGRPVGGWGNLIETAALWRWLRDGTPPPTIAWTGSHYHDLVDRLIRTATYLRSGPDPILNGETADRVLKATLFAGDNPSDPVRAALNALQDHPQLVGPALERHAELKPRWCEPGRVAVTCWCGQDHDYRVGPYGWNQWMAWRKTQTWPLTISIQCSATRQRPQNLTIPEPPPNIT